jgi:hypothetical protein
VGQVAKDFDLTETAVAAPLQLALEITHLALQARNLVNQPEQVAAGGHPPRVQPLLGHTPAIGGEPSLHPDRHGGKVHERQTSKFPERG